MPYPRYTASSSLPVIVPSTIRSNEKLAAFHELQRNYERITDTCHALRSDNASLRCGFEFSTPHKHMETHTCARITGRTAGGAGLHNLTRVLLVHTNSPPPPPQCHPVTCDTNQRHRQQLQQAHSDSVELARKVQMSAQLIHSVAETKRKQADWRREIVCEIVSECVIMCVCMCVRELLCEI